MSRKDLSLFNNDFDLFDPFFNDNFFRAPEPPKPHHEFLRTDIIENENDYEIVTDVPGIQKEDVNIEMEDGYLTISVEKNENIDSKDKKYIRKERHSFKASRSFYVGNVSEEEIKAKMEDGVLHVLVPKEKEKIVNKRQIVIE